MAEWYRIGIGIESREENRLLYKIANLAEGMSNGPYQSWAGRKQGGWSFIVWGLLHGGFKRNIGFWGRGCLMLHWSPLQHCRVHEETP